MLVSTSRVVGRDDQLEAIRERILATARGERGVKVVFVTGEAGIGKSTLLKETRRICESLPIPARAVQVECSTPLMGEDIGEVESLAPWIAVMRELVGGDIASGGGKRRLVGELAMAWVRCIPIVGDVLESVADTAKLVRNYNSAGSEAAAAPIQAANQQEVFQQYVNLLDRLSSEQPLVLMIDDFHWADTSSTNLLFTAARGLRDRRVLFIVAYRLDDATSARSGQGHPILHIRNELERYSLASEIDLPRLTSPNVDTLLHRRYPNYTRNEPFEEWLVRASDGNALFITQFLETLEESGAIDRETGGVDDAWRSVQVPGSARAVLEERIRRLDDEARELLRYASVEGDLFTSQILGRVSGIPILKLLQQLRQIEEKHRLLRNLGKQRVYASETTAWQFKHWLLQQAMYEGLGHEERELLHEMVLGVLQEELALAREGEGNIPGIAARLAVHARTIRRPFIAAEALLAGAEESWGRYAEQESLRQIASALDAVAEARHAAVPLRNLDDRRADIIEAGALLLKGRVAMHRGRHPEASDDLRRAVALLEGTDDSERLADALNHLASLLRLRGKYPEAIDLARRAGDIALPIGYQGGVAGAHRVCGIVCYLQRDFDGALAEFTQALEIDRRRGDRRAEAAGLANIGAVHYLRGDYDRALAYFNDGIEISRSIDDRVAEAQLLNNIANLHELRGHDDLALADYRRGLEIYRSVGGRAGEATLLNNIGNLHSRDGNHELAIEQFQNGLAVALESRLAQATATASLGLGRSMLARRDDLPAARRHLEEAQQRANENGLSQLEAEALGLLGELCLVGSDRVATDEPAVGGEPLPQLHEGRAFLLRALELNSSVEERDRLDQLLLRIDAALNTESA